VCLFHAHFLYIPSPGWSIQFVNTCNHSYWCRKWCLLTASGGGGGLLNHFSRLVYTLCCGGHV